MGWKVNFFLACQRTHIAKKLVGLLYRFLPHSLVLIKRVDIWGWALCWIQQSRRDVMNRVYSWSSINLFGRHNDERGERVKVENLEGKRKPAEWIKTWYTSDNKYKERERGKVSNSYPMKINSRDQGDQLQAPIALCIVLGHTNYRSAIETLVFKTRPYAIYRSGSAGSLLVREVLISLPWTFYLSLYFKYVYFKCSLLYPFPFFLFFCFKQP